MKEFAQLRVVHQYEDTGDGWECTGQNLYLTLPDSPEEEYMCRPATGSAALTWLAKDGWEPATSVGLPFMATGGGRRTMTSARPSQLIHTLVREEPAETGQL